jgi:hypothetical protein
MEKPSSSLKLYSNVSSDLLSLKPHEYKLLYDGRACER